MPDVVGKSGGTIGLRKLGARVAEVFRTQTVNVRPWVDVLSKSLQHPRHTYAVAR